MQKDKEVKFVKKAVLLPSKIAGEMAGDFMEGLRLGFKGQRKIVKGKCPFCGR